MLRCSISDLMHPGFFDVKGTPLPCCLVKDTTKFTSLPDMREQMLKGIIPDCCKGCPKLVGLKCQTAVDQR